MLRKIYLFVIFLQFLGLLFVRVHSNDSIQLKQTSNIYTLAQEILVLNSNTFAIGRWDGTITIYRKDNLLIEQVLITPQKGGVTMLTSLNNGQFVSSNGSSSIALWNEKNNNFELKKCYLFDECFGSANSGVLYSCDNINYLITGHSEGYLLTWMVQENELNLLSTLNIKSDHPIDRDSPYQLWNICSVLVWKNDLVITASEDGDLCLIHPILSRIIHRQRYNITA